MNRKILGSLLVACLVAPLSLAAFAQDAKAAREVVSFKKFKEAFPEKLGDLVRNKSTGTNTTVGEMTTSNAKAEYAKDKDGNPPTVEFDISDFNNPQMVAAMTMWVKMNVSSETDDEWTKTTKIDGHAAMVKYNSKDKDGTYTILVADRFIFTVNVNGMKEDEFKKVGEQLPLKALADLAK
jgi:hypothetical protein